MDRCFLTGLAGDAINAVLAAAGSNLRKLLRRLAAALISWLYTFPTGLAKPRILARTAEILRRLTPAAAIPHPPLHLYA